MMFTDRGGVFRRNLESANTKDLDDPIASSKGQPLSPVAAEKIGT